MGELFLTKQMPFHKGIKRFGRDSADAVVNELKQLDRLETIEPHHPKNMTGEQK